MTRLLSRLPTIAGLAIAGSLLLAALVAAMLLSGAPPVSALDDDGDGFDTAVEQALGSDPDDPTSTPEHLYLPLTCGDGIDNDGDGLIDLDDTAAAGYPTTSSDGGCAGDADGDGFSDLTEIDAGSRPYAAVGGTTPGGQPEDLIVPGTACDAADNVDQDGDGDMDDDGFGIFVGPDTGCLDGDGDGHSNAREAAFGSDPGDDTSTPENLLVNPGGGTHVCLDGIDNDGDGLTDVGTATTTGDDGCRIMVRTDMNKAFAAAAGTDLTPAIEQCRVDFDGVWAFPFNNAPVTVHYRIENATPLFAFGEVEVLYDSGQLNVTTGVSGATAPSIAAGIVDFWTKNGAAAPTSFDEGVTDSDGRWTGVIVSDIATTGPTGDGAVAEFAFTTLADTNGLTVGATSIISIDPTATTFIIRSQSAGTITADGGIPRNNPHSLVPGAIYFDSALAGGACPSDGDVDGVDDRVDNCPAIANPDQADNDFDSYSSTTPPTVSDSGDVCDTDDDNDGKTDADEETFGSDPFNPGSTPEHLSVSDTCSDGVDNDKDGDIDAADPGCTAPADTDQDGIDDADDNCPNDANPGQEDTDSDGIGDACDNCPDDDNPDQENNVHPGTPAGDACEDPDSDGVVDASDNCPDDDNPGQNDDDGDQIGDACDTEAGVEGVGDCGDGFDNDGDGKTDGADPDCLPDADGDGIADANDTEAGVEGVGDCGDGFDNDGDGKTDGADPDCLPDADGDGIADANDTEAGVEGVGDCGDGFDNDGDGFTDGDDLDCKPDADRDGIDNASDNCPKTANSGQEDQDGDKIGDVCDDDKDGDDAPNASDNCPAGFNPDQADQDKDGTGDACDTDKDGDGVANTADNCVNTANSGQADQDKDGAGDACDTDKDGDGIANAADNCANAANSDQKDADNDGIGDACDTSVLPVALPPTGLGGPANSQDNAWILLALGGVFLAIGAGFAVRRHRGNRAGPQAS